MTDKAELPEHNPQEETVPEVSQTHPGGRPPMTWEKFQLDVDMVLVERMVQARLTEWQIAVVLGVSRTTIYNWKLQYPEFLELLKKRPMEDDVVVRSLFEKATGYNFQSEELVAYEGNVERVPVIKHIPPSDTAIAIWLNNRSPEKWGRGMRSNNTEINIHQMVNVHVTSECVITDLTD
jgi:hypothetical protein